MVIAVRYVHWVNFSIPIICDQEADFALLNRRWRAEGQHHAGIVRIPARLQGAAQISFTVKELLFLVEAERSGAVDVPSEIENQFIYL